MTNQTQTVYLMRGMLLPIWGYKLLLPSIAVAEIVSYKGEHKLLGMPQWFMGMMEWRGTDVPLILLESIEDNESLHMHSKPQVAILNAIRENNQFPYLGIFMQGFPKLTLLDAYGISAISEDKSSIFQMKVLFNQENYFIPNLDKLQTMVENALIEKGLLFQ